MDEGAKVSTRSPRGAWTPPVDGSSRPPRRSDRVFGVVMVLLWVAWLVLTGMTQARLVSPDRLRDDLAAGRVTDWRFVDVQDVGRDGWAADPAVALPAMRPDGTLDPEQEALGGRPSVEYHVDSVLAPRRIVDPGTLGGGADAEAAVLRAAGVPPAPHVFPFETAGPSREVVVFAALPLLLMMLVSVGVGPRPTRGSRWFWFWQLWVPLGLGVLAYAVLEQVRPAPALGAGQRPRRGGWLGLGVAILSGVLVAGVLTTLADATHWLWLVRP
ncbi:hypothetical protein [Arthrobacter sp. NEB 688]|uniref:hypothetical protein n=1 Tax=Arthrobacter sp. NEB 688 TaxID=904039 RepID=UPI001563ABFF|nr:hypothetical protein [Arthrobacter sp. NEB 688]QKE83556.1 hypothetical protein HL663_06115 [Arthrobacter sp. NEB 688]